MKFFVRFIKRLSYRVSKRLIRLLIFFHLLSLLLVSSVSAQNIYEYNDMQELAEGGTITTYIGNTPGVIDEVKYTINNFQSFDDITITDDNTFKNCSFYITNAKNINAHFNTGDVVYIRQKVVLNVDRFTNPTVSDAKNNFYISVSSVDSSGVSYITYVRGVDIVDSVTWTQKNTYDEVVYILNGFVRLPNINGSIESISYNFDSMSTGTVRVRIYPQSSTDKITYFVGQENNAPVYDSVNTDQVDDYHNKEDEILDEIQKNNPLEKFNTFFSSFYDFFDSVRFPKFNLFQVFSVWSYWLDVLLGYAWFKFIVYCAITIGLFAFTFSIVRDGLSGHQSIGKDKSNNTSISKQRYSNLGG